MADTNILIADILSAFGTAIGARRFHHAVIAIARQADDSETRR
ncbi:hypothetical protein [Sphingomonas alpina]|nr:hypothetical protein [Sphingomonas alpina]